MVYQRNYLRDKLSSHFVTTHSTFYNQNKSHCRQIVFGKTQDFKLHFLLTPLLVEFNYKSDSTWECVLSIWCMLFRVHVMNVDRNNQLVFMSRAIYQPDKLWTTFSKNLTLYTILCKIGRNGSNAPYFLDLICQMSATTAALKLAGRMKCRNHNAFCLKISGSVRQTFPGGEFDLSCQYPSRMPSSFIDPPPFRRASAILMSLKILKVLIIPNCKRNQVLTYY